MLVREYYGDNRVQHNNRDNNTNRPWATVVKLLQFQYKQGNFLGTNKNIPKCQQVEGKKHIYKQWFQWGNSEAEEKLKGSGRRVMRAR